jgi:RimJ/RimL family protein N-acetyltransferase
MNNAAPALKEALAKLAGVTAINEIQTSERKIEFIDFTTASAGMMTARRLTAENATALYDFYFNGLSTASQDFFPPYPLFAPAPDTAAELKKRILDWQQEGDWNVLTLFQGEQIIGICILKRYHSARPTSGLAVSDAFQGQGLGLFLQTIINEQARLLELERVYATVAPDNENSLKMHRKSGFRRTGKLVPHYGYRNGKKVIDRQDIELVKEFQYE